MAIFKKTESPLYRINTKSCYLWWWCRFLRWAASESRPPGSRSLGIDPDKCRKSKSPFIKKMSKIDL
jgi:hypothetical protein